MNDIAIRYRSHQNSPAAVRVSMLDLRGCSAIHPGNPNEDKTTSLCKFDSKPQLKRVTGGQIIVKIPAPSMMYAEASVVWI